MIEIRSAARTAYSDVYTPEAVEAIKALAPLDDDRRAVMASRIERRRARAASKQRIGFLDPNATIARTNIRVQDARDGKFAGSEIPADLQRQWIQGTGPATKPHSKRAGTPSPKASRSRSRSRSATRAIPTPARSPPPSSSAAPRFQSCDSPQARAHPAAPDPNRVKPGPMTASCAQNGRDPRQRLRHPLGGDHLRATIQSNSSLPS